MVDCTGAEQSRLTGGAANGSHVPESFRVARTAIRGHLPIGLPGSFLRSLATVLPSDPSTRDARGAAA